MRSYIMLETVAGFDWDEGNLEKCQKHGVSAAEIEGLFARALTIRVDVEHSLAEERLRAIGKTDRDRYVFWCSRSESGTASVSSGPSAPATCTERRSSTMKKKIPIFKSDEEAERFVETADLSEYDVSQFKPVRFEFEKKDARVNMRLPEPLLAAVKARAKARGIPYQRFIREALEQAVTRE
jgi:predicted DNA binding CopG/RHH family protein/uncharacterized DUF497 family protein